MKDQIEKTLKILGLNDKEVKVYLALLPLGNAPASILGKRTGITRSTAQYTCQQLVKKGLVLVVEKNNTFVYSVESPDKILFLLEQQKKEIETKKEEAGRVLADLKAMMNKESILPKVQFFEGREGFINIYKKLIDTVKENDEIIGYSNPIDGEDVFNVKDIMWGLIDKRLEKKVKFRLIARATNPAIKLKKYDQKDLRETRLVHAEAHNYGFGENFIHEDKMYHVTITKNFLFGYIVQDKLAAQLNRNLFEVAWRQAKIEDEEIWNKSEIKAIAQKI
ncbi:MAG: TrmB family transcriptional regulator [bacterium]